MAWKLIARGLTARTLLPQRLHGCAEQLLAVGDLGEAGKLRLVALVWSQCGDDGGRDQEGHRPRCSGDVQVVVASLLVLGGVLVARNGPVGILLA